MLLRQTLLYLPSQLAGPAMQFAFAIIWTHWLSQADYGLLTFLIASQELIFLCCVSWWSLFVLRFFGGAAAEKARTVVEAEPLVLAATCIPQVLMSIVVLTELGRIADPPLVIATLVYVVSRCFVQYFGERVRTQARILLYTIVQVGALAAGGLLGFLFVVAVDPSATSVVAGFAIAHLAVAGGLFVHLRVGMPWRARVDRALLLQAAGFGLPLIAAGIVNWVNLNGIRVVVEAMGGASAVGLLAVGWGLGQRLSTTVAMLVTTAAFPLAARSLEQGATKRALRQLEGGGTLLVGLVVPAALGLWVVTPPFVHLLIAAPFRPITLSLLPLAVAIGAMRNIRVHYADMSFILFERTGLSVLVNSVEAVSMLAFCTIGFRFGDLHGAVAGAFVASTIGVVLAFGLARRAGLPLPIADWSRILVAALAMTGGLLALRIALGSWPEAIQIVALAAAGTLLYAVALALLFPRRTQAMLRRGFARWRFPAAKLTAAVDL